ncbi:MAG: GNAT family protein [Micrococcus sp.]|nr:GNAT family protein [Micrococcus sp.]
MARRGQHDDEEVEYGTPGAYPRRTERLLLRPLTQADVDVVVAYRNDPDVARYQDWDLPVTRERVEAQTHRDAGWTEIEPGVPRQIGIEHDGELVGDLYVGLDEHGGVAEIGFTLRAKYQGQGFAWEAASAVVAELVEHHGCHRIIGQLSPENTRSARLLEKLGMHVESRAPKSYWCRGAWDDNLTYAMSDDDWRAAQAGRTDGPIHGRTDNVTDGDDAAQAPGHCAS